MSETSKFKEDDKTANSQTKLPILDETMMQSNSFTNYVNLNPFGSSNGGGNTCPIIITSETAKPTNKNTNSDCDNNYPQDR